MKETDPTKLDLNSHDIAEERRQDLLRLFPEIRTEGDGIDFERLKLALGEQIDTGKERYGLNWPGKADCFRTIQAPSLGTLRPAPEESIDFDTTENLIIEGDNLEVLKLLQKSYAGKIKMIYIDPPYNTGNDFIYPDNYTESLQTYLEYTGQVDAQGKKFSTNTDADGRFHSKWLNMMYPRLYLARNLLSEDGLLFVSCDDNEINNLRSALNEIFGEENFFAQLVWKARQFTDVRATTNISTDHEYILIFSGTSQIGLRGIERDESKFSNPDNDVRGPWMSRSILGLASKDQRPNLHFDIVDPASERSFPPDPSTGWRYSKQRIDALISQGKILFPKSETGRPREKKFRNEMQSEFISFRSVIDDIFTANGTAELKGLFQSDMFAFPKPSGLIQQLVQQAAPPDSIILDFFAGSGTTAHAVLDLNKQDQGNRKFILIQLPEPTGRADYPTIADICKERVRRVIQKIKAADSAQLPLSDGQEPDLGFRVYKLAESNFQTWNADLPHGDTEVLADQLKLYVDHVRKDRSQADLLTEILLKSGFPLTTPVEELKPAAQTVFSVASGALLICLEKPITLETVRAMAEKKPARVVCLDAGFAGNDQLKANAALIFKSKAVNSFKTV